MKLLDRNINMYQIIILYILNLHKIIWLLYLNKAEK